MGLKGLFLTLLFFAGFVDLDAQQVLNLKLGESHWLKPPTPEGDWYLLQAVQKEYENTGKDAFDMGKIRYVSRFFSKSQAIDVGERFRKAGTWFLGFFLEKELPDSFSTAMPLQNLYPKRVTQLVIRSGDGYFGYLDELRNLPFILPPRLIPGQGQQVDIRQGCDCASFAIYGRLRMGFEVPYRGPKGIVSYLEPVTADETLQRGNLVHFGGQVSVFYRDVDQNGRLDPEDLLFQCYPHGPQVVSFRNSGWFDHGYKLYRWKD